MNGEVFRYEVKTQGRYDSLHAITHLIVSIVTARIMLQLSN